VTREPEAERRPIPSRVLDAKLVEQRRLQIVKAAVDLFVAKGFHKTTTREIARASGLGIGTLYEYVQSKEDVLYLVCAYIHGEMKQRLLDVRTDSSDPRTGRELLIESMRGFFACVDALKDYVLLIYQESKSLPPDTLKLVLHEEEEITLQFAHLLEQGRADGSLALPADSVRLFAHNIVVLGQMWTFRGWALGRHYELDDYVELQIQWLLSRFDRTVGR